MGAAAHPGFVQVDSVATPHNVSPTRPLGPYKSPQNDLRQNLGARGAVSAVSDNISALPEPQFLIGGLRGSTFLPTPQCVGR